MGRPCPPARHLAPCCPLPIKAGEQGQVISRTCAVILTGSWLPSHRLSLGHRVGTLPAAIARRPFDCLTPWAWRRGGEYCRGICGSLARCRWSWSDPSSGASAWRGGPITTPRALRLPGRRGAWGWGIPAPGLDQPRKWPLVSAIERFDFGGVPGTTSLTIQFRDHDTVPPRTGYVHTPIGPPRIGWLVDSSITRLSKWRAGIKDSALFDQRFGHCPEVWPLPRGLAIAQRFGHCPEVWPLPRSLAIAILVRVRILRPRQYPALRRARASATGPWLASSMPQRTGSGLRPAARRSAPLLILTGEG
jgi:hypothetical protein